MKKLISLILLLNLTIINSSIAINIAIEDDFANSTLNKNLKIEKNIYLPIRDDFANSTLNKNLKITNNTPPYIQDENIKYLKNVKFIYYSKNQKFNFEKINTTQKIEIKPTQFYSTKKNLKEGSYIDFELAKDIKYKNKIYKKNTLIKGRIETIELNGAFGNPASLVLSNFTLPDNTQLVAEIEKTGANRSLWIYPISYTLTTLFFGLGLPMYIIRGGHAKLYPSKTYVLIAE